MNPNHSSKRRRRVAQLAPECLESRELLTGGSGSTFAIVTASVATANQPTAVQFTIDPKHFTIPKGKMMLGIDVVAATGTTVQPMIATVDGPNGKIVPTTRAVYTKGLTQSKAAAGTLTSAVLAPIHFNARNPTAPVTYTVNVVGLSDTTGQFLVGFYLPGNASGSGTVTQADVNTIKSELGANANSTKYTFDADVNRDGKISLADLSLARQNLGVSTTVSPIVSANLDSTGIIAAGSRTTRNATVHFTGTSTPDAAVVFQEVQKKTPAVAVTADALGNYSLTTPLVPGANTFQVTTKDAFGQSISGTIAPVTYDNQPPVTAANLPTLTAQAKGTAKTI